MPTKNPNQPQDFYDKLAVKYNLSRKAVQTLAFPYLYVSPSLSLEEIEQKMDKLLLKVSPNETCN